MTKRKTLKTKPEALTIANELKQWLNATEIPLSLNTAMKVPELLTHNPELQPYVDFLCSASRPVQDAALDKIRRLPFNLRYTYRITRTIQKALADVDLATVGIDVLAGIPDEHLDDLWHPDIAIQFSLFLTAMFGFEETKRIFEVLRETVSNLRPH